MFVVCITILPLLNPTNIRQNLQNYHYTEHTHIQEKMAWLRLYIGISVDFLCLPKAKHSFLRLLVDITCLIHNGTQIPFTSPWRGNLELVSERRRMWKFQDGDEIFWVFWRKLCCFCSNLLLLHTLQLIMTYYDYIL